MGNSLICNIESRLQSKIKDNNQEFIISKDKNIISIMNFNSYNQNNKLVDIIFEKENVKIYKYLTETTKILHRQYFKDDMKDPELLTNMIYYNLYPQYKKEIDLR